MESMESSHSMTISLHSMDYSTWNPAIPYGIQMEYPGECKVLTKTEGLMSDFVKFVEVSHNSHNSRLISMFLGSF
jgi:hypothetical protein